MLDGHLNKCKDCTKSDVSSHRKENLERIQAYDRQRHTKNGVSPERWQELLEYKNIRTRAYREANPKKYAAHRKVGNAIRDGILIPEPCEVCGKLDVHGHHCDYDKPNGSNMVVSRASCFLALGKWRRVERPLIDALRPLGVGQFCWREYGISIKHICSRVFDSPQS
jgi:hypothetical protein